MGYLTAILFACRSLVTWASRLPSPTIPIHPGATMNRFERRLAASVGRRLTTSNLSANPYKKRSCTQGMALKFHTAEAVQSTEPSQIMRLSTTAHQIITERMTQDFHNGLSDDHSEALMRVVGRLSLMAFGRQTGRWAMDLPCGAGKTQGVVAWLTAVHRLGVDKSCIVAASH